MALKVEAVQTFVGMSVFDPPFGSNIGADYLSPVCPGAETYFKNAFKDGKRNSPGELRGEGDLLLAKLYRTTVGTGEVGRWFEGRETIENATVLIINPEKKKLTHSADLRMHYSSMESTYSSAN